MSPGGTHRYRADGDYPDLVRRAIDLALDLDFEYCCHPATGRLLSVLAGGVEPGDVLADAGTLTVDDFAPFTSWPPTWNGREDTARTAWIDHPDLLTTEIKVAPDMAVLVCRRIAASKGRHG